MTTEEKRAAIAKVYPGQSWKQKVANMCESQVIAVYLSFEKNGTFRRDLKKYNKPFQNKREKSKPEPSEPKQLSIDDILR